MPSSHYRILNVVYLRLTQICPVHTIGFSICPVHTIGFSMWFTYASSTFQCCQFTCTLGILGPFYPKIPNAHYRVLFTIVLRLLQMCKVHTIQFLERLSASSPNMLSSCYRILRVIHINWHSPDFLSFPDIGLAQWFA